MLQNRDIQLIPFELGEIQRETLFALYRLLLHPYIETAFGWNEMDQQNRFESEHPNSAIKLIKINTVFTGFAATRLDKSSFHVTLLLLEPEFQSRGIGEQSMLQIQAEARAIQLPVTLSCFTSNHRALAFYQRIGYRITSSDENFVDLTNAPIAR
jgi:ribosomal protein S18 acetylase RimI-like enzyme